MKITPSIIIAAIVATVGGAAVISLPTAEDPNATVEYRTGFQRNNPHAPEVDLQKTIVREDKTKFTTAQHLVQINKNNVIISVPDEKCTELKCERIETDGVPELVSEECQIQFDCIDENLRKAEQRISLNEQNEKLYLELLSAKKELGLDIPSNLNPYLLK